MPTDTFDRDEYVATVVHELRGPLTIVSVYAERLDEPGIPDAQRTEMVALVHRNVKRINAIIDGLLELDRQRPDAPLERNHVDVRAIVERVVSDAHDTFPGRRVTVAVPADAAIRIAGDEDAIVRAIGNLVTNALTYSDGDAAVNVEATADGCTIAVTDRGIGILPEAHGRLFERFARIARPAGAPSGRGTGLGLAISKTIIQRHGGSIAVDSEPGRGTTMTVHLPATR